MGTLFFLTLTPLAIVMRVFGKRPLSLEFDKSINTYWITRPEFNRIHEDMRRQF